MTFKNYKVIGSKVINIASDPHSFQAIPQFFKANYSVTGQWKYLENHLASWNKDFRVDLEPDFQRGHKWNDEKRSRYVEYILMDGPSGRDIFFNCPTWNTSHIGAITLVDGLQRLTAARMFLANKLKAFGKFKSDFSGYFPNNAYFNIKVNTLETRREVLEWYLQINAGGVVHTKEELDKVRKLLQKEPANG